MLLELAVSNFCSIAETQTISFQTHAKDRRDNSNVEIGKNNVNLVSSFVGSNASGKTTALKAMAFLLWLIRDSYESLSSNENGSLPITAHQLHQSELTKLSAIFFSEGYLYKYEVELDSDCIHREYLGVRRIKAFTRMFEYTRDKDNWKFRSPEIAINKNDLARFKTRKNVSVFCSLIKTGYLSQFSWLSTSYANVTQHGLGLSSPLEAFLSISRKLQLNRNLLSQSIDFIRKIDAGIGSLSIRETEQVHPGEPAGKAKKIYILECEHQTQGGNFTLPLIDESNGSRQALELYTEIQPILESGGVAIIDEIEFGLHPYLAKKIISLFENKESNPKNAQLIFSTHQHILLKDRTKTQIFITEKTVEEMSTEIYRLDDVDGVRNDENFCRNYLDGEYGGVPSISWSSLNG